MRAARAAWRLEHLDKWQRDPESLSHFDPEFIYDAAHEYDPESTTDPDYGAEGVHLLEYDEDGVVSPLGNGHGKSRSACPPRPPTRLPARTARRTTSW